MSAIFNLVYHPWIPVHTDDGTAQEMSLLEVFQPVPAQNGSPCSEN